MRFLLFPMVRFSLFLILGIVTAHFSPSIWWFCVLPVFLVLLGIQWRLAKRQVFQKMYFGLATYVCFFTVGVVNYQVRLPQFQSKHYTRFLTTQEQTIILEITENLKPDRYHIKFIAEVHSVSLHKTHGRLLLQFPIDSLSASLFRGDRLLVVGNPSEIPRPLNPHQFNYNRFMELQDVYGELRLLENHYRMLTEKKNSMTRTIHLFRSHLIEKLKDSPFGNEEKGIIEALVLGYRGTIDRDLYKAYAAAGAIHILAVSGLHVGIIFLLLQMLLSPLGFVRKGRRLKVIILVLSLWAYAVFTGLSPSVTRAVTMFTFFGLAQLLNRPTNPVNSLFLSLFFLLLWNPKWLFHVGFQLSYSAVFFILWIQPKLYKLYRPKYYADKLFWTITTVSLAAQLGVAPLSIYYFNQFPGLFLVSNLVILPFISILVGTGLVIIGLLALDMLPLWLAKAYNLLITLLNDFVKWISLQDGFIFSEIHFSGYLLAASYFFIIALLALWNRWNGLRIIFTLIAVLFFLCIKLMDRKDSLHTSFTIFHKNRTTLIGLQQGDRFTVYSECSVNSNRNEYPLKSFVTARNIRDYSEHQLPDVLSFNSKIIMIVDSSGVYPMHRSVDIVLLRGSPKVHLDRLIDSVRPLQIIADGSNYTSYVERWRKTCALKKLPFHHTGDRGAFTLE